MEIVTSYNASKNYEECSNSAPPQLSIIVEILTKAISGGNPPPEYLIQAITYTIFQSEDMTMLGFLDHKKVYEILNTELLIVIGIKVAYCITTWFLVGEESLCNIFYADTLKQLGLCQIDLSPYSGGIHLAFNNYVTHPWGMTDLPLSLIEEESEIKGNPLFLGNVF